MQIRLSREFLPIWRTLPPEVRAFVQSLRRNPRPPDALVISERQNRYEEFIGGVWIIWQIDESGGETIVRVTLSENI